MILFPKYMQTLGPHPKVGYTVDVLSSRPKEYHIYMERHYMTFSVHMVQERHLLCWVESRMEK